MTVNGLLLSSDRPQALDVFSPGSESAKIYQRRFLELPDSARVEAKLLELEGWLDVGSAIC